MFESLSEEIRQTEIPVDGEALIEWLALIDRMQAKGSVVIGELETTGMWERDAWVSMETWLRVNGRFSFKTAAAMTRTAVALRELPVTAAAWLAGELSGEQVQAIRTNVPQRHRQRFADDEAEVVAHLVGLSVQETTVACATGGRWPTTSTPGPSQGAMTSPFTCPRPTRASGAWMPT